MIKEIEKRKSSKFIIFLLTLYMSSILIFSTNEDLNIYSQLLFIVAFGSCAAMILFKSIRLKVDKFIIYFIFFILVCRFSEAWALNATLVAGYVNTLLQLLIMSVVLLTYITYGEDTEPYIKALLLSGLIGCAYILGYYGFDGYMALLQEGERAGTEITNVNTIGMYMAFSVIIGFYYGYVRKKKIGYFAMILPLVLAMGSASRKALVAMAAGVMLIIFLDYRKKITIKTFFKVVFMFCIVGALIYWLSTLSIFSEAFERFFNMFGMGERGKVDSSTEVRTNMIQVGWGYFLQHPFTGCGIGNTRYIAYDALGHATYLHNNFVELLASVGIFGFLFYYSMYIYSCWNLYRIFRKRGNTRALILFVLLVIHIAMDYGMVSYYDKMSYIYLTIGAAEILIEKRKDEEKNYVIDKN